MAEVEGSRSLTALRSNGERLNLDTISGLGLGRMGRGGREREGERDLDELALRSMLRVMLRPTKGKCFFVVGMRCCVARS